MATGYTTAWMIYLVAVLVAHGLLWSLTRRLPWRELQQIIHLCVFALLITPARLEPDSSLWVPAFMAATMEGIDSGPEAASNRMWPVLVVMLVLVVLSVVGRWYLLRRRLATQPPAGQSGA